MWWGLQALLVVGIVKHIVLFDFRKQTTEKEIQSIRTQLLELPRKIPGIVRYELGDDLLLPSGQKNHAMDKNRRLSWTVTFRSVRHYERYAAHAAHVHLVQSQLRPLLAPGSRAAIQYNVLSNCRGGGSSIVYKTIRAFVLVVLLLAGIEYLQA